jgi:hypothetical protein
MQRGLLTDFAQLLHNFFRPLAFLLNGTEHFRLTVKQTTGRSILKRNTDLSSGSLTGFRRLLFYLIDTPLPFVVGRPAAGVL